MKPEHNALGLYYFNGKSIEESTIEAGIEPDVLEKLVKDIDKKSIMALKEFYSKGGTLGYVAVKYGLNRNELLGFMGKYGFNANYEDEESKEKIKDFQLETKILLV